MRFVEILTGVVIYCSHILVRQQQAISNTIREFSVNIAIPSEDGTV